MGGEPHSLRRNLEGHIAAHTEQNERLESYKPVSVASPTETGELQTEMISLNLSVPTPRFSSIVLKLHLQAHLLRQT